MSHGTGRNHGYSSGRRSNWPVNGKHAWTGQVGRGESDVAIGGKSVGANRQWAVGGDIDAASGDGKYTLGDDSPGVNEFVATTSVVSGIDIESTLVDEFNIASARVASSKAGERVTRPVEQSSTN